jgi:hypothetical protein
MSSNLINMTDEQLREFAATMGITYSKACSLRNNEIYRMNYRKAYNQRGYVKAKRAEKNREEYELRRALKNFVTEEE